MQILIAPNAFKDSLDAVQAAQAIQRGLERSHLQPMCTLQPIADGGDGMLEVMLSQANGAKKYATVEDPLGRPVKAAYGLIQSGKTAVIEMAEASGLRLLSADERDPCKTSTFGTGQLIQEALNQGVREIVLGVGGSATVDGGLGIVQALGAKLTDDSGNEVPRGSDGLAVLGSIDVSGLDDRLKHCRITVPCDVTNTLVGAAEVFGPQKGASPELVVEIEQYFLRYSDLVKKHLRKDIAHLPRGGAAGGVAAALYAFFDADLVNGTAFLLAKTGFQAALDQADLLITTEGALDQQTQGGKGPFYVAQRAQTQHKPVIILVGSVPKDYAPQNYPDYDAIFPIGPRPQLLEKALKHTAENLERTAYQIGNLLAIKKP
ncbi:glycerate kinase family protein [Tunicatimonas pelagia]|uniref:glycerate kinase family protein n=1 Tax=Tunicatimonas pelagia TaxID=931531 RepID=UPI002666FEA5|nr:glycerate kinase [Tunicatimonas pelagia]WKN44611.1 glycerate kinase [Tunicatimonas pelagia]